jgi:NitT/TauT family transport system ATP-binding protein
MRLTDHVDRDRDKEGERLEIVDEQRRRSSLSSGASPLLSLDAIQYSYPSGLQVLSRVTLHVGEGEVVSIVGPSGCGKSTLLAVIANLLRPSAGTVVWNSAATSAALRSQRMFTLMFQKDTLLPWLTVERNIAFGLRYVNITSAERRRRLDQLLEMVDLGDFRTAHPHELSGGMRRRVALLMSVAPLPRLLLLDEPFVSLDEPTKVKIHAELLSIVREFGIATLLVTHDVAEAITLANRIYILTSRPTNVATERAIPFVFPRDVRTLRELPEYQKVYAEVWRTLRLQIEPSDDTHPGPEVAP